ncbi:unnamed protein product [Pleuronectes platessa]|uniref:Uncharacterized protein n=1 Tax=Pleuronectes platessa TaxID=8262 RepID=A0A9N7UMR4_PLEPL|nr:unnamed protein product [Pleuronectes platessa]
MTSCLLLPRSPCSPPHTPPCFSSIPPAASLLHLSFFSFIDISTNMSSGGGWSSGRTSVSLRDERQVALERRRRLETSLLQQRGRTRLNERLISTQRGGDGGAGAGIRGEETDTRSRDVMHHTADLVPHCLLEEDILHPVPN